MCIKILLLNQLIFTDLSMTKTYFTMTGNFSQTEY